jgi:hypothetical protein
MVVKAVLAAVKILTALVPKKTIWIKFILFTRKRT